MKASQSVGVITMHRVYNYGSALQAYATQTTIEKLGNKCEIIDYWYPNEYQFSRGVNRPIKTLKSIIGSALGLSSKHRKMNRLRRFIENNLNLTKSYHNREELIFSVPQYDVYLTGSDQVWNPKFTKGDPTFLCDFTAKGTKKVSYASSFSTNQLPEEIESKWSELLNQYSHISVRENGGVKLVESLTNGQKSAQVVLDPTLLLNKDDWAKLVDKSHVKDKYKDRDYILVYKLDYAFNPSPTLENVVNELQKSYGCEVISIDKNIPLENSQCTCLTEAGVVEFLQLFMHARCVVTSSFHGTVFAVNFGKRVFSIVGNASCSDDRQSSFLSNLGIPQAAIPSGTEMCNIDFKDYDKKKVEQQLALLRSESIDYLESALEVK